MKRLSFSMQVSWCGVPVEVDIEGDYLPTRPSYDRDVQDDPAEFSTTHVVIRALGGAGGSKLVPPLSLSDDQQCEFGDRFYDEVMDRAWDAYEAILGPDPDEVYDRIRDEQMERGP